MIDIDRFSGEYEFLNNLYESPLYYNGEKYNNAEDAFNDQISKLNDTKYNIMYDIIRNKFVQNFELLKLLVNTYPKKLINKNTYNEKFWGVNIDNIGENNLGKILMDFRDKFIYDTKLLIEKSVDKASKLYYIEQDDGNND